MRGRSQLVDACRLKAGKPDLAQDAPELSISEQTSLRCQEKSIRELEEEGEVANVIAYLRRVSELAG